MDWRRSVKVYADTSVYGGAFDAEFERASRAFFDQVEAGRFRLSLSAIVQNELANAPEEVRELVRGLLKSAETIETTDAVLDLRDAYLRTPFT